MTDIARLFNPAASINTEAEARESARASAIALFVGALWSVFGVIYMLTGGADALREAAAQAAVAVGSEGAGMAEVAVNAALWGGILMIVVQLGLGLFQWTRPGVIIPIIFALLTAYGLLTASLGLMNTQAAQMPMALTIGGLIVSVVQLLMHVVGVRGGMKLDKLRKTGAVD